MSENTATKGPLQLDPVLVTQIFNTVKGKSSLAACCGSEPMPFNGRKDFVFEMTDDFAIVGEGEAKPGGKFEIKPVVMIPLKLVYQTRVTDEFLKGTNEAKLNIMQSFVTGCAAKLAAALDLCGMHGIDPKTGLPSAKIGDNCLDKKVTQHIVYDTDKPDDGIDAAIAAVEGSDMEVSAVVIAPATRSDLARMKNSYGRVYPEFAFGGKPNTLGGFKLDVNGTVSKKAGSVKGYVGDFSNCFKWGYAQDMTFEVIEYGDPDNTGRDLKGHNEVCLRTEAYIGWGILAPQAFARLAAGGISLDQTTATVAKSGTKALTATTTPSGETVTWTSSNTTVATVSGGTVTGVAAGTATITASITVDGVVYSATCDVTVTA